MSEEFTTSRTDVTRAIASIFEKATLDVEKPLTPEAVAEAVEGLDLDGRLAVIIRLNDSVRRFFNAYQAEVLSPAPNAMAQAQYGIACGIACEAVEHLQSMTPGLQNQAQAELSTKLLLATVKRVILTKTAGQLILPVGRDN